ncbi:thioredoxin family protein [Paenibacillus sp. ACRRX]|uniref:thioredoxin family protein n=1 Tax=unclassified Paenibacillus TaxID=185978 RepID=UPI001EF5C2EE|nr:MULTISPECIES: thioredoxin family protein [unclassified Paenibacillus]MCG7407327.1 thioredoxin family protein [Paenibacillus sp. ACRRX]MDK8180553.1 thioredoxin family protein [Paenibacillus sp. UMB4589-SE434]
MQYVTDHNVTEYIQNIGVTLLYFSAPWCSPCRALAPLLEELEQEHSKTVTILAVNVDESPATAAAYGIMSTPTVLFLKQAEAADKLVGLRAKSAYSSLIKKHSSIA